MLDSTSMSMSTSITDYRSLDRSTTGAIKSRRSPPPLPSLPVPSRAPVKGLRFDRSLPITDNLFAPRVATHCRYLAPIREPIRNEIFEPGFRNGKSFSSFSRGIDAPRREQGSVYNRFRSAISVDTTESIRTRLPANRSLTQPSRPVL